MAVFYTGQIPFLPTTQQKALEHWSPQHWLVAWWRNS